MGLLTAALVATSVATSVSSAIGSRKAANYATNQAANLARDAQARGEEDVTQYRTDLAQLLGRQRAVLAASNVDLTQGSAAQVASETARIGELDVTRIRENARREAVGLRQQGEMTARSLRAGANAAIAQAGATLLTSGIDAWGNYQAGAAGRARLAVPGTTSALSRYRGSVNTGMVARTSGWRP